MKGKGNSADFAIAAAIFLGAVVFLVRSKLSYLAAWLVVVVAVMRYGAHMPWTASVGGSVITVAAVIYISGETIKERYENPSKDEGKDKEKEEEPDAHVEKDKDKHEHVGDDKDGKEAHLDAGTTILHAFQKLKPDQVMQMRNDTKELMNTQKQLVDALSALGPQVKQGAELVNSFKTMFSGVTGAA